MRSRMLNPMSNSPFTPAEYETRLAAVRRILADRGVDLLLLSSPENIYYLTGLDHWGYFAPHILILPIEHEPVLVTRAMEKVTVADQVTNARFEGHGDHETAADAVGRVLAAHPYPRARIGIEAWSAGLPHGLAAALQRLIPNAQWLDLSGAVDDLPGVRRGRVVAFGASEDGRPDRVILVVEPNGTVAAGPLTDAIRRRIGDLFGIYVDEVAVVPSGTVGRTTSGKVQRSLTKARYERGELLAAS